MHSSSVGGSSVGSIQHHRGSVGELRSEMRVVLLSFFRVLLPPPSSSLLPPVNIRFRLDELARDSDHRRPTTYCPRPSCVVNNEEERSCCLLLWRWLQRQGELLFWCPDEPPVAAGSRFLPSVSTGGGSRERWGPVLQSSGLDIGSARYAQQPVGFWRRTWLTLDIGTTMAMGDDPTAGGTFLLLLEVR